MRMKGGEPLGESRPFVAAVFNTSPDTVEMLRVVLTQAGFVVVSGYTFELRDLRVDLDAFMRSCREQFDLVVIDSPAILPMAGNLPFMRTADRAVLVVEWDRTERRAVLEAVDMLGADAGKLAGVVLNKVAIGWYRLFGDSRYMKYFDYAAAQGRIRA